MSGDIAEVDLRVENLIVLERHLVRPYWICNMFGWLWASKKGWPMSTLCPPTVSPNQHPLFSGRQETAKKPSRPATACHCRYSRREQNKCILRFDSTRTLQGLASPLWMSSVVTLSIKKSFKRSKINAIYQMALRPTSGVVLHFKLMSKIDKNNNEFASKHICHE